MKEYTQKELNEIWEQAIPILLEKFKNSMPVMYINSSLYKERNFNIIFHSGIGIVFIKENYKNYIKAVKEVISNLTGIENINVCFKSTKTIEPDEKDKFEMMEERLDKIEELIKNINK